MEVQQVATLRGVAVAIVVLARFIAANDRRLEVYLEQSLEHASTAGLEGDDLALLRAIIKTVSAR